MKLTRYVPRDTLLDRLAFGLPALDRFFGDLERQDEGDSETAWRVPRTNIHEEEKAYVFTMEMPGVSRDNVEVHVEGDRLLIKGEKSEKTEEKNLVRREYHATRYERSFGLGNDIDSENVVAKMEDGVLTVTLPKRAEKVGRKIQIS